MRVRAAFSTCAAALALQGCIAAEPGSVGTGGGASAVPTDEASSVAPSAASGGVTHCRSEGWSPSTEQSYYLDPSTFYYSAVIARPGAYDVLDLQFYEDLFAVGELPITPADYYGCTLCVHISTDCDPDAEDVSCGTAYLANAGSVEIDAVTDRFVGRLRDVEMIEVTIDGNRSTPVPRGLTWCLDAYEFDVPIQTLE